MKHYRLTPAFSMLELVFVIVILGIVASIGSEMIVKVYESYIVQRAEHRATLKTELAATQIANRLSSAIPGTVYRIKNDDSYEPIESALTGTGDDYIGLQWVGSDTDSFSAAATPGWSGFCDIDSNLTTKTSLSTPGSDLDLTNTIIGTLSNGKTIADAAIYFPGYNTVHHIATGTGQTITLDDNASKIVEHYKLAWSSYALVVENNDLYLYYNFIPTPAIAIPDTASRSLIMKDVSTFKFMGAGRTIRFKMCKQEPISEDVNITACKEKAVF
ncbi:MAG TPA: type II secretion system protein [Sulfurovum sp.]|uniref:type II secretion system protein n=1 Tax=Sulfurovum sp. TaxID=1969726 RepID=UPI002F926FF1